MNESANYQVKDGCVSWWDWKIDYAVKGEPIVACVDAAVSESKGTPVMLAMLELYHEIETAVNELTDEQKTGKSRQAESPTVLEAIDQARYALTESLEPVPHYVINSWLDYIEKAAREGGRV